MSTAKNNVQLKAYKLLDSRAKPSHVYSRIHRKLSFLLLRYLNVCIHFTSTVKNESNVNLKMRWMDGEGENPLTLVSRLRLSVCVCVCDYDMYRNRLVTTDCRSLIGWIGSTYVQNSNYKLCKKNEHISLTHKKTSAFQISRLKKNPSFQCIKCPTIAHDGNDFY